MKKIKVKKLYKVMRPTDMEELPKNGWVYEPKMDGSRGILILNKQWGATFLNRKQIDCTPSYPELFDSMKRLRADQAVVDGEVVAVTKDRPLGDFKSLAQREHVEDGGEILSRSKSNPLKYFAFDILEKDGRDLTSLPLSKRKESLDKVIPDNHEDIKEVPFFKNVEELSKLLREKDAEGYVAKKLDSAYQEDKKSKDWQKKKFLKTNDIVVVGYQKGKKKREGLMGSLIMAVYDKKSDSYKYVGKVGTGFNKKELKSLTEEMNKLKTDKGVLSIPGDIVWVKPKIVGRVSFLRQTEKGRYREPRWVEKREDISTKETHPFKNFGALVTIEKRTTIGPKKVRTLPGKEIIKMANQIEKELKPFSQRTLIAGSIRRKKDPSNIADIDLLVIPKDKEKIKELLRKKGTPIQEGNKKLAYNIKGVKTEVYMAKPKDWGSQSLFVTGSGGHNIGLRRIAQQKKMKLNQYGLWKNSKLIASKTERDIYRALGRPIFKKPEERI